MSHADTLTSINNWQKHVDHIAELIGTRFRNQRLLTKKELLDTVDGGDRRQVVRWMFEVNPSEFGARLPFYGLDEPPEENEFFILKRKLKNLQDEQVLDIQYVPKAAYRAFQELRSAMKADNGYDIEISSAYRSPAFQALIVCYNLRRHSHDLFETMKFVTPPGYSEHGLFPDVAIDLKLGEERFMRSDRVKAFAATAEFDWLKRNAGKFGFQLSYPESNGAGLSFEPWHWRFKS